MITNSRRIVRRRAPIRYITQLGVIGAWAGVVGGDGAGGNINGGGGDIGEGMVGRGNDIVGDSAGDGTGGTGVDSVVKAPTALQARRIY